MKTARELSTSDLTSILKERGASVKLRRVIKAKAAKTAKKLRPMSRRVRVIRTYVKLDSLAIH